MNESKESIEIELKRAKKALFTAELKAKGEFWPNGELYNFPFKNSKELALVLGIKHSDLMEFYWYLENQVINRRELIDCCLVVPDKGRNYIKDMAPALILAFFIKFGEKHSIMANSF